jgi:hypothetical protein
MKVGIYVARVRKWESVDLRDTWQAISGRERREAMISSVLK